MDKLISNLLRIEQTGRENLQELEQERAHYAKQTADEIKRGLMELQLEVMQAIEAMKLESEVAIEQELDAVEVEFSQKAASLQELYNANEYIWREELVNHVLYASTSPENNRWQHIAEV